MVLMCASWVLLGRWYQLAAAAVSREMSDGASTPQSNWSERV